MRNALILGLVWVCAGCAAMAEKAPGRMSDEQALLAADGRQREAIATGDIQRLDQISHPNLLVNAPGGRVIVKEDLMRAAASGGLRDEVLSRTPERVMITGDIGVVMGREEMMAAAGSEHARLYGEGRLVRRYTNVFLRENGGWLHIARHASIVPNDGR